MASLITALLCDFAQVRERVLFVASGGISRVYCPAMPAPIGVMLAVMAQVDADEMDRVHSVLVSITHPETATQIVRIDGGFQVGPGADVEPGESILVPFVADIRNVGIASYGAYDVKVAVDGGVPTLLTFWARPPPT